MSEGMPLSVGADVSVTVTSKRARRRVPGGIDGRAGHGRRTEREGLTGGVVAGGGQFAVDRVARGGREVDARPAGAGGLGRQVAGEDQHRCRGVGDRHGEGARRGLPAASTAEQVTVVVPSREDVTGGVVTVNGHVTVDRVARGGREADARPAGPVASAVRSPGRTSAGGVVSLTVTWKEPDVGFPAASAAEQVTVVAPTAKVSPEAWSQVTGTSPSTVSLAETEKSTLAPRVRLPRPSGRPAGPGQAPSCRRPRR